MAWSKACGFARIILGSAALSGLCLTAGGTARAADAQPGPATVEGVTALGEVVVTAQKRSENLQSTPIAITAFTGSQISQAGIAGAEQLQFSVPSMTFGNNDGYSYITLRGIGTDTTTIAGQASVADYVDGVYIGNLIAQSVPSFDIQRIEVLRGPQGTLYGRNTTGGVVNYITTPPSFEPGLIASAGYGNYNAVQGDIGVTGPLIADKVAARLSFHYDDNEGYRYNLALNRREDADQNMSGRAAILFTPSSDLSITLRGDMAHEHDTSPYELISQSSLGGAGVSPATPLGLFSLPEATLAAIGGLLSPSDLARLNGGSIASYEGLLQAGPLPPDPTRSLDLSNGSPSLFLIDSDGASATIDWRVGTTTVKSISAFRYSRLLFDQDSGGYGTPDVDFAPLIQTGYQYTQEFDVSGKAFDDRLDWLVGVFYLHDQSDLSTTVFLPSDGQYYEALLSLSAAPGSPYAFNLAQPLNQNLFSMFPSILSTVVQSGADVYGGGGQLTAYSSVPKDAFLGFAAEQTTQSVAGFAQATYKITDALRLTGGFRYTYDEKNVTRSLHSNLIYTLDTLFGAPIGDSLCNNQSESHSWTAPTGTVGLDYDAAPHVLTYAKASWGYKSGGANPGVCSGFFNPEYLTDYEGGVKAIFADGQILTNAAIYYYDYTNIQFTTYIANAEAILNAGSATAFGVELEYAIQPRALPGFRLDGSASYEDSHYGAGCFDDPAGLAGSIPNGSNGLPPSACPSGVASWAQIKGNELIRAPRWKTNVGAQYSVQTPDGGSVLLRGEAAYTDTIFNDIFNGKATDEGATTQPAYWVVNARLVWTSANRRYEAQVFGANLSNSLYATNRVGFNTPATEDNVSGQFAPPRTFGVKFTMKLGSAAR